MADRFLLDLKKPIGTIPISETKQKKLDRNKKLAKEKNKAINKKKKKYRLLRRELKKRTLKYNAEYRRTTLRLIKSRRHAKRTGIFFREPEPKVLFIIRIKGINKLAPKPKKILQLFRLRQIHNGVFVKVNKATINMVKSIEPFVAYGYPSLSSIRKLIYKRGYVKIGRPGSWNRIRITNNDLISKGLGKFGIHGVEDLVYQIYTCGPYFKQVTNYLWPFKLTSPRGGFVAKRHGFNEPRGGDWGNREHLINELIKRML